MLFVNYLDSMKTMSSPPDRIPMETQKVKRRRLFLDEGVTADENRQTGERLEHASTSKSYDALEGQNVVEQSKVPQQ